MQTILNSIIQALAAGTGAGSPEFVHLLPSGTFTGADGRGPYLIGDPAALVAASSGRKLPIDVNHAIDHLGAGGHASPAVGWIVALEVRSNGLWGKVEWTEDGKRLVEGRAYGFLSPVFTASKSAPHRVAQLLRASLTNDPNLTLTSLHQQNHNGDAAMENELREALGLPETADKPAILAAVKSAHASSTALAAIMKAANVEATATAEQVVTALQARGPKGDAAEVEELRGQVKELNTRLTETVTAAAKDRAEQVVTKAIEDGKVVPALRDRFIARHIKDPADVEAEIKLMPSLHAGGLGKRRVVEGGDGKLSGTDAEVCELMGLDPKEFAKTAAELAKEMH